MPIFILDTDILSLLRHQHPATSKRARERDPADICTTVFSLDEQLSGWYTQVRKAKNSGQIVRAYRSLIDTVERFSRIRIFNCTETSLALATKFQQELGTHKTDSRIAAIAVEQQAILVTRNLRDFQSISGLTLENWADSN